MKLFLALCMIITSLFAGDCRGIVTAVKVGEYGKQESNLLVTVNGSDYNLGTYTDPLAKVRFSVAQSALIANHEILLRFYQIDCLTAATNKKIPNSTQLK